jgi:hypothetical protein
LAERITMAAELYPCDLLFVHRDAESELREHRVSEIRRALDGRPAAPAAVCVVPVRMQEAWLLFDESALRRAAGCPNGAISLQLPPWARLEPNPKEILHNLLRKASGLKGRRAKSFRPRVCAHRLADLIDDFSPLRNLRAFRALEEDLKAGLSELSCLA